MSATFELSGEPGVNDSDCFFFGHLALANGDHITVTVLFGEARSLFVPDHGTSNPAESVGNDGFVPTSADNNTIGMLTPGNSPCRRPDKVRIVYRIEGIGSEILNSESL